MQCTNSALYVLERGETSRMIVHSGKRSYAEYVRLGIIQRVMQVVFSMCIASNHRDKLKDLS